MRKSTEFTMENDKGTLSVRLQELTVREVLDMCEQFGKARWSTIWSGCCRGCPTSPPMTSWT